MRCACIDIGSNTTRLLVADRDAGGLVEVTSRRTHLRLCSAAGVIAPARIAEVAAEVALQVELARRAGAQRIRAVATAAVRHAVNGDELCEAIAQASGVEVAVLSGDEEARLAFAGALRSLPDAPAGTIAVVDVGGGSTEIVCGTAAAGVTWAASLPIGSGLLADQHLHGDPPALDELSRLRAHIHEAFAELVAPTVDVAYAVGGSATSLRRVLGPVLDEQVLEGGVRTLTAMPAEEAAEHLDLHAERVRVLPAGMLLLAAASAALGRPLGIVGGGLREGVVLAAAEDRGGLMAKPVPVPLDPGRPFAEAAELVVRVRAGELFAHADRALDIDDIEGVHDMRVATRRLRAALEVFAPCFRRREFRPVLHDVKQLADALGERRDPDVWLLESAALAAELGVAETAGVRELLDRLRVEQATANGRLAAALDEAHSTDLAGRLIALAGSAR